MVICMLSPLSVSVILKLHYVLDGKAAFKAFKAFQGRLRQDGAELLDRVEYVLQLP